MKYVHKNNLTLFILILSAGTAYKVPYLKAVFYDELINSLQISNSELGMLTSVYAIIKMIIYIPCGILADRLNLRKVLSGSLYMLGILTAVYALMPDLFILRILHGLYAVANVFFWPSFIKGIRILGEDRHQGKVFGFSEGFRGIAGSITTFISLRILDTFITAQKPLTFVLIFYTFVYISLGATLGCLFPDKKNIQTNMKAQSLQSYITVFKMPAIWIISLFIFTTYSMQIAFEYTTSYLTQIIGISMFGAGIIATFRDNICGIIGSPAAGVIADRMHSPSRIASILAGMEVLLSLLLFIIPANISFLVPITIIVLVFATIHYGVRGTYYSSMTELNVPVELTATGTAVVAVLGYTPDIFMHLWCGNLLDSYGKEDGFRKILLVIALFAFLSFLVILGLRTYHKKKRQSETPLFQKSLIS